MPAINLCKKPHIVFILADDVGWNDVGYHSSPPQIPTPNIDRLAAGGVKLSNYYVNPVCSPTRASLLSGRSMMHHGIQTPFHAGDSASGLNLSYTILPEQLEKIGYKTMMVGKWHVGMKTPEYLPSSRSFHRYFGYYNGASDYWKHYSADWKNTSALDMHKGGVDLGIPAGKDIPLYNTSGQYSTFLSMRRLRPNGFESMIRRNLCSCMSRCNLRTLQIMTLYRPPRDN